MPAVVRLSRSLRRRHRVVQPRAHRFRHHIILQPDHVQRRHRYRTVITPLRLLRARPHSRHQNPEREPLRQSRRRQRDRRQRRPLTEPQHAIIRSIFLARSLDRAQRRRDPSIRRLSVPSRRRVPPLSRARVLPEERPHLRRRRARALVRRVDGVKSRDVFVVFAPARDARLRVEDFARRSKAVQAENLQSRRFRRRRVARRARRRRRRRRRRARRRAHRDRRPTRAERRAVRHSMTRAVNAFVVVVVLGTALGVRAVHESQTDERRRLREGVVRDAERLRARATREKERLES